MSPLAELLPERTTPELRYLQTKWASLMSYGMTVDLLKDVLPVSDDLSTWAIRTDVERAAQRLTANSVLSARYSSRARQPIGKNSPTQPAR